MKRKNVVKSLLWAGVCCLFGGFAACAADNQNPNPGIYDTGIVEYTGFLPGAQETVLLGGDSILLKELIDVPNGDYTITVSDGTESKDYTKKVLWIPDEVGEYTVILTVKNGEHKGTYTHKIQVVTEKFIEMSYYSSATVYYERETTFAEFFQNIDLTVMSHSDWTPIMQSVYVDGELIEFSENQTSYYISSVSNHLFTFEVRTPDGRNRKAALTANVIYSDVKTDLYLNVLTEGTYTIEKAGVQSVKVNGETCADAVITDTGVSFSKKALYKNYMGANFVSVITAEGEYRETINVYPENYGFESQVNVAPDFIYWWDNRRAQGAMSITDQYPTEGNKALMMTSTPSNYPQFAIKFDFLASVFADESVDELTFDLTYVGTTEAHTGRKIAQELSDTQALFVMLESGKTVTLSIARSTYETYANGEGYRGSKDIVFTWQNSASAAGGSERPMYSYLDNFRAVRILETDALLMNEKTPDGYLVALRGVETVKINGEPVPADKLSVSPDHATIDTAYLSEKRGENVLEIIADGKLYQQTLGVYSDSYDFENGVLPKDLLTFFAGMNTDGTMEIAEYNGSKAAKLTGAHQWQNFVLPGSYVHAVFADNDVAMLQFDVTVEFTPTTDATTIYLEFVGKWASTVYCTNGVTKKVVITRSMYETWAVSNQTSMRFSWGNQAHNTGTVMLTWYVDNLMPIGSAPTDPTVIADFNGQLVPEFIQFVKTDKTQEIAFKTGASGEDGDFAFRLLNGPTSNPQFYFVGAWLDSIFADASVSAFTYDFMAGAKGDRQITSTGNILNQTYTNATWTKVTFTRAMYDAWKSRGEENFVFTWQNQSTQVGGTGSVWALFDNFKYVFVTE